MRGVLEFVLNGRAVRVQDCSPNLTLLEYLRNIGYTGSKEGCAEGDCGACSVAIIDRDAHGNPTYRAINSCLVPLPLLASREIITVEGVAHTDGSLHPVQQKMVECHGSQCGYCTPGFIMSLFEGYYRDDLKQDWQLDDQLCGNLCRCTGYRSIREAAFEALAQKQSHLPSDPFATRLEAASISSHPASPNASYTLAPIGGPLCAQRTFDMGKLTGGGLGKPLGRGEGATHDYRASQESTLDTSSIQYEFSNEKFFRPTSLIELFQLLHLHPEARLIAGATELGLEITKKYKKFPTLISVEATSELKEIQATPAEWRIGAAVNLTQMEEALAAEYPAMADMLRVFGSRQIRNRATLGGNLATASPIGDNAPVLLALDAAVVLASAKGERTLPLEEFFIGYRKTALQPGEILKTILIPRNAPLPGLTRKFQWYKVSKRREMDISTVAGCFLVDTDGEGIVRYARLAYGGVAAMTLRARKTEQALLNKKWNEQLITGALPILRTEFTPISDVRGAAHYRAGLITSLLEKFFHSTKASAQENQAATPITLNFKPQTLNFPRPLPHESAPAHVTGAAVYTDDQTAARGMLETWPVCSPHARAKILKRDVAEARRMPGIKAVLLAEDIPGRNDVGPVVHDEILLADKEVFFHGHLVALVVGESQEACRAAAAKVIVEYEPLTPLLSLPQAVKENSFHNEPSFIRRGDIAQGLQNASLTLEGEFEFGGQEHFYLETNAAWAQRGEDNTILVTSSTQHPSEVQTTLAHVLDLPMNKVIVQSPRMGGGFGGKETQAATPAALAALAAYHTRRPVRVRLNRDQDMMLLGHRHPFLARFHVGFDAQGMLLAVKAHLWSNGGWSLDLSQAVTDRAVFHLDNSYYISHVEFRGQVAKLNVSSNTAFRGFGGPQGMLVIEEIIDRVARRLGLPPELVRERNLYRGKGETNTTHYGQEIEDNRINLIWDGLKKSSELEKRRAEINSWNARNPHRKRGIAMTPVKFGISFTVTHLNQAGALVLIYQDGTVQVNHGGTEMGQGIHTNMQAIAARELGIRVENVRVMHTSTDKIPNTSATAASAGTDLNGAAVKNACEILRARLAPVAAEMLKEKLGRAVFPDDLKFADSLISLAPIGGEGAKEERLAGNNQTNSIPFFQVVQKAYFQRISLSSTGYYRTPDIHWDRAKGRGKPFHYFAYGAAVTEVEVDGFTGMMQVLRTDILHDVGDSINAGVNRGQIEGGFVQGMGWLTTEELKWDDQGRLQTHSPDTYKIPAIGDRPRIFNVQFLQNAAQKNVIHGSKAVGEPPLMLALSVREAIRDAVGAFGDPGGEVALASPSTCEAIFAAIQKRLNR